MLRNKIFQNICKLFKMRFTYLGHKQLEKIILNKFGLD